MPKRTAYLVFASVLAGAPVTATTLSGDAAPAVAKCLGAPKHQATEGRHWYYRIERTSNRRCWYLGPAGAKVRVAKLKPKRHHMPVTKRPAKLAAEPPPSARHVAHPVEPSGTAMPIDDPALAQGGGQLSDEQEVTVSARQADVARVDSGRAVSATSMQSGYNNAGLAAQSLSEWTLTGSEQKSVHPFSPKSADAVGSPANSALLVGGIATAAIVVSMMLGYLVQRQRLFTGWPYTGRTSWSQEESILPILARLSAAKAADPAEPWKYHNAIGMGVPASSPQRENIAVAERGNVDHQYYPDLPKATQEIDLLLQELEMLAQRPAA